MVSKLDLYRIFQTVSQNKSFSQAGQELFMTQSAVSQAMAKLEKELGVSLFFRTPKGVSLTDEGKVLESHVRSAFNTISIAENEIINFKEMKTGELRIGVGDTIARYFLLPYLENFYGTYPKINLKIMNGTTNEILDYLKSGEVDVGICHLPIDDERFFIQPCKEIHDVFVCSPEYPIDTKSKMSFEELMDHPLIFLEDNSNSRRYVENYLNKKGYELSPVFELGSYDLVMELAKINLGISCVVREFAENQLRERSLVEIKLEEEIPKRHIGIVNVKNYPLSQAAQKFVESIQ